MKFKIVSDSSADLLTIPSIPFASVPLKIITDKKEYIDDADIDVFEMIADLLKYKGVSKSSCPNIENWLEAFEDAENIFCVTITRNLSGSYNAARIAADEYMEAHKERNVYVVDTLSVGPESTLIIDKLIELIEGGLEFNQIKEQIEEYQRSTHLLFCLESLRNLANNGRVNGAVAKIAGILGIRVVGKASLEGTLELTNKCRGEAKAHATIIECLLGEGYCGGKIHIHHCKNQTAAKLIEKEIKTKFPSADIVIRETRALCSFYAESGGLLIGFEGKNKK
ncbi:MAG: DegV family protein [Clostridia bacterium]|nr:DegV family protein [Clostridia bacterium]